MCWYRVRAGYGRQSRQLEVGNLPYTTNVLPASLPEGRPGHNPGERGQEDYMGGLS